MGQDYLPNAKFQQPPERLFDCVMLAIKDEQAKHYSQKLIGRFCCLLIISLVATSLSAIIFSRQLQSSGILYFISTAISNLKIFIALWPDFVLAILEALPLMSFVSLLLSLAISFFILRFFLYRKKLLFHYSTGRRLINS